MTENIDNMLRLRLPKGTPGAGRKARIDEVIAFLGLSDVRDQKLSLLGSLEQFLTRVGAELAGSPIVLLVDEPENTIDPAGIHRSARYLSRCRSTGYQRSVCNQLSFGDANR